MRTRKAIRRRNPRSAKRPGRTNGHRRTRRLLYFESLEDRRLLAGLDDGLSYAVVDTGQMDSYDDVGNVIDPSPGEAFYGQDGGHDGDQPSYTTSADGLTVDDNVTGLTWTQSPDWDGDGDIDANDKFTWGDAQAYVDTLNAQNYGGYSDWRLPSIKELYSLIDFSGITGMTVATAIPYIDTDYFAFGYGDEAVGQRIIDAQYWSSTEYVSTTMGGMHTVFGVNFADGRIKGYGTSNPMGGEMSQYVRYVRGNTGYGVNNFVATGDGTVMDNATGLMWANDDSGFGMDWEGALAWAQEMNEANYLGHNDWRLPNAKELQSIVAYTRAPDTTDSAAIDPVFDVSTITDGGGDTDFPFFWTSTTHLDGPPQQLGNYSAYVAFGEAEGWMWSRFGGYQLQDVHGAGAQRSDPKSGDPSDYPYGHGPQGDVIRIYNYVRLVRDADVVDANASPIAEAGGPYAGDVGSSITLDASGSADSDGSIVLYEWDLDDDGQYDDATGVTTGFGGSAAGIYTVGLRVTDDRGAYGTDTAIVNVGEVVPPEIDSFAGPGIGVRLQTLTFSLSFSDTDAGDTHVAAIDWGDGSPTEPLTIDSVEGGGSGTASHRYSETGTYTVVATVQDSNGQSANAEVNVQIEVAALLPDPAQPDEVSLFVGGTASSERIYVYTYGDGELLVLSPWPRYRATFAPSDGARIYISAGDGHDLVWVDPSVMHEAVILGEAGSDWLYGGGGNDRLVGGEGNDVLYGTWGDDRLSGGSGDDVLYGYLGNDVLVGGTGHDGLYGGVGRDVLIGGVGKDALYGWDDDDILIGGTTQHDENDDALLAILAEWASETPIDTRIGNLLNGGGVNGTVTLDEAHGDDEELDWVLGGSESDWLWAFPLDQVIDNTGDDR